MRFVTSGCCDSRYSVHVSTEEAAAGAAAAAAGATATTAGAAAAAVGSSNEKSAHYVRIVPFTAAPIHE
mgnify:CR=1 FL=1